MKIHKEGRKLLFWLLVALAVINLLLSWLVTDQKVVLDVILLVSVFLFLLVLEFLRNPSVQLSDDPNLVYGPADGKVVVIEEVEEQEYLKDTRRQISIFMSPINVHV